MKILFASPYCLLDPSSGASISCRTILEKLSSRGHITQAVSATIFDRPRFQESEKFLRHIGAQPAGQGGAKQTKLWVTLKNGVKFIILQSQAQQRRNLTCGEAEVYQGLVRKVVSNMKPDLILAYGGRPVDRDNYRWFSDQGIPTVFYLANANYKGGSAFRDVSLVVTDTKATSNLYKRSVGIEPLVIGKFVNPVKVISDCNKEFVTFINPSPAKGVSIFLGIAQEAQRRGLDTKFLVVQSRGNIANFAKALGMDMAELENVTCIPMQDDMTNVWNRTKMLLCPSLWHESGARTIVEACSVGAPVLATDSGGSAELLGGAGFLFEIPPALKERHLSPATPDDVKPWVDTIERLTDDEGYFLQASKRASKRWNSLNSPDPIIKLEKTLEKVVKKAAREAH